MAQVIAGGAFDVGGLSGMTATYDSSVYNLAKMFLVDVPHLNNDKKADELATLIQRTIEDWIEYGPHATGAA